MSVSVPERRCDIIMKGGITSGVVYPLAIVELSQEFRFKNIGGTSAGAIAAALTAAAEYRRVTTGSRAGFDTLALLPDFLAGATEGQPNLPNLFPPAIATRRVFAVVRALLDHGSRAAKTWRTLCALAAVSPLASLVALVLALAPLALVPRSGSGLRVTALVLVEVMALVVGLLVLVAGSLRTAARVMPANGFGFSTGMAPPDRTLPGVTEWLHATIQEAAGRGPEAAPLTFGDLWSAEAAEEERAALAERGESDVAARAIDLQMLTTALSHGRPYHLPFDNRRFSFKEDEFRRYFPAPVVDHLVARSGAAVPSRAGTVPLPPARDLPVLVAARLSLSFPALFAMVPLHAVDFSLPENQDGSAEPERCWFIDGGLGSNFPVTLFDAPLPRWPTFCIDLSDFHPAHPKDEHDESNNVWMVEGNERGTSERWLRFPSSGLPAMAGFAGAMLDTILNWRDNTQLTVPGYRDRIVHVKLSRDEGGLNLDMSAAKVKSLSERGRFAAVRLRERFGEEGVEREGLNWNTHRWTRFRSTMTLFQKALRHCAAAAEFRDAAYPSYPDLIARTKDEHPRTGYWWARNPQGHHELTGRFLDVAAELGRAGLAFEDGAPRPRPELQITPRL